MSNKQALKIFAVVASVAGIAGVVDYTNLKDVPLTDAQQSCKRGDIWFNVFSYEYQRPLMKEGCLETLNAGGTGICEKVENNKITTDQNCLAAVFSLVPRPQSDDLLNKPICQKVERGVVTTDKDCLIAVMKAISPMDVPVSVVNAIKFPVRVAPQIGAP